MEFYWIIGHESALLFHRFQTAFFMQAILILKILLAEGDIVNYSEPISIKEIDLVVKKMPPSILYLSSIRNTSGQ